jgi:hypothetical protein
VLSIGSLLDEPFTGVVYLKGSGITSDFTSLKGKRMYVKTTLFMRPQISLPRGSLGP